MAFVLILVSSVVTGACEMGNSIQQVKAQHEDALLAVPGVVSVGIGRNEKGDPAIIVGVETEEETMLSAIPENLNGYPVEVRHVGKVIAH